MMLALDFIETVTHRVEEILVGGDDRAVHLELDHRLRPVDRGGLRQCITGRRIAFPQRHKKPLINEGTGAAQYAGDAPSGSPLIRISSGSGSHQLVNKDI